MQSCDYDLLKHEQEQKRLSAICDDSYFIFTQKLAEYKDDVKQEFKRLQEKVGFENARATLSDAFFETMF